MRIVCFYPSLLADWNNPDASSLRGVAMELVLHGHEVNVYEPRAGASLGHVLATYGHRPIARFHAAYPGLASRRYDPATLDLDDALAGAALVIVHDATAPSLVRRLLDHRARCGEYRLLWHATRQPVPAPGFDAVLAASRRLAEPLSGDTPAATMWPAFADTRIFKPLTPAARPPMGDAVWIGSCGDDAQLDHLQEYFLRPVQRLGLQARVYGASFSPCALQAIAQAGVQLGGWVPDFELPSIYAAFRVAVLLPSRAGAGCPDPFLLPALACGRPVLAAAWDDAEQLLHPGRDYLVARDGNELTGLLARVLADREVAATLAQRGRQAVLAGHTAADRVRTLLGLAQRPLVARVAIRSGVFAAAPAFPYVTH